MNKNTQSKATISQVFAALLVGVIAVPTAMTGLFQSMDMITSSDEILGNSVYQAAIKDAARVRQLRRDYWRAIGIYNELDRMGIEVVPPDINDAESIAYFLDATNFSVNDDETDEELHGAAPSSASDDYNALPERYRDLLDGYILTGRCPGTLRQYHLANFYEICVDLLDEHIAETMPTILERSAYLRGFNAVGTSPVRTLKNRLIMMEESLHIKGASIRPQGIPGQRRPRIEY
ncbi:hypothetical protein COU75_02850 [Candidatus Peregrinibacteria bacterium CG10_big_fil_rev_8_21_14_0_10_42_8]|nr:MAG: hypothetical protein COU75_02850 [Candidatus Peregrinibacteria bacterium CG10_big_fil_rev_8_21_14_0_10_42_8]